MFSVATNLPGCTVRTWIRKSSAPESATELISSFLDHLFDLETKLYETIPDPIRRAISKLTYDISMAKFSKMNSRKQILLGKLRQYCNLSIMGYNSGKMLPSVLILHVSREI